MSTPKPRPADEGRPPIDAVRWTALAYVDGELGQALDIAKQRVAREARAERLAVAEWVQSPAKVMRVETYVQGHHPTDGTPITGTRREMRLYLVAVLQPCPPERWVRLTSSSGPAAVEVATVERGKITKIDTYHPEDVRYVSMGMAQRALEETGG